MANDDTQARGNALADALAGFIAHQPPPIPPKTLLIALGKCAATCFQALPTEERNALAQRWISQILWLAEHTQTSP